MFSLSIKGCRSSNLLPLFLNCLIISLVSLIFVGQKKQEEAMQGPRHRNVTENVSSPLIDTAILMNDLFM